MLSRPWLGSAGSAEAVAAICHNSRTADGEFDAMWEPHPVNGSLPLHIACLHGHHECVSELLSWGADPATADRSEPPPASRLARLIPPPLPPSPP